MQLGHLKFSCPRRTRAPSQSKDASGFWARPKLFDLGLGVQHDKSANGVCVCVTLVLSTAKLLDFEKTFVQGVFERLAGKYTTHWHCGQRYLS